MITFLIQYTEDTSYNAVLCNSGNFENKKVFSRIKLKFITQIEGLCDAPFDFTWWLVYSPTKTKVMIHKNLMKNGRIES